MASSILYYNRDLAAMLNSVVAAVIVDAVDARWKATGRKQFKLFGRPCNNPEYRTGLSWAEVCCLSESDLRYGLPLVATKLTPKNTETRESVLSVSRPIFDTKGVLQNSKNLMTFKRVEGVPIYEFNEVLFVTAKQAFIDGTWQHLVEVEKTLAPMECPKLTDAQIAEIVGNNFSHLDNLYLGE